MLQKEEGGKEEEEEKEEGGGKEEEDTEHLQVLSANGICRGNHISNFSHREIGGCNCRVEAVCIKQRQQSCIYSHKRAIYYLRAVSCIMASDVCL